MAHKYFSGVVPKIDKSVEQELELGLESAALRTIAEFEKYMGGFVFHKSIMAIWHFINRLNKYIDVTAPWVLAKEKTSRKQLEVVIYNLLESLRIVSGLIYPIMPGTAKIMQDGLGMDSNQPFYHLDVLQTWETLVPGSLLMKPVALFPRIDVKKENVNAEKADDPVFHIPKIKPEITMDQLGMIDLRVATVIHAEAIPKTKKLLKLDVDIGERRTIVAGISENYHPKDLVGKQVIIVANLKPAKLMGVLSNGMLMAAVDGSECAVATLDKKVRPGIPLT
jgi:methionyl-tRNA synthetase